MSEEKKLAALALLICNPWPDRLNKHLDRNQMLTAVDGLSGRLRDICGALCSHVVDASRRLFDSKWDSFALECEEKEVKVVFLYICSHAKVDSEGDLQLWLKGNDILTGSCLMKKILDLHRSISKSKVIVFLECCNAGALILDNNLGISSVGIAQLVDHPFKVKLVEDQASGIVVFMSCKREEKSWACIFASSLVEILEKNKNHVTAKMLVDEVSDMVKSKTRNSTWCRIQNPTFSCVRGNIEEIGIIGGCGEEEMMEIDPPFESYLTLENSYQDSWNEISFKENSEKVKGLLENLRTELSEELRKPVDDVITVYENVDSLETRIVFCGESGCGKSTLINAMVGYAILPCSGGHSGCTSTVIEIRGNKDTKKFKANISILEKSAWNEEAERLRKTLTNEECDAGEQAKELLEKVYGSSIVQDLPEDVEQLFQEGVIELEEENHLDLSKKLSRFVSNGLGQEKEYWPIVKKVEIFIPDCDILQGGLVLVDIPGFVDPNPVRKVIAEKEYTLAKNVCVCTRTARSGGNETLLKLVKDYNENLKGRKEVTFILTRSDDDMKEAESYFQSLGNLAEDYDYLNDLHEKVGLDSDDDDDYHLKHFEIECAKHRNSKSRENMEHKIKEDDMEDGSFKRPVHSVSGLDYMFMKKVRKGRPFFRTPDETGVPDLINSLKQTAGNHVISKIKRFLSQCQNLPAGLENSSSTSPVTANIESDLLTALEELEKNADKTDKLCQSLFQEIEKYLNEALENDFQTARADGICTDWKNKFHHMTLKAALMRSGQYTPPKKRLVDLNANLLHNTVAVFTRKFAELITKIRKQMSDFLEKELNGFVEFGREKHPERKPLLLTIEESGKLMEDDVCESLEKFLRVLKPETLGEMSTLLASLYSQLVEQNDYGPEARYKFVKNALHDMNAKEKLIRSINRSVRKEKLMCSEKLKELVAVARQQMSSSLYDESVAAESDDAKSIRNFKKQLDLILGVKE